MTWQKYKKFNYILKYKYTEKAEIKYQKIFFENIEIGVLFESINTLKSRIYIEKNLFENIGIGTF